MEKGKNEIGSVLSITSLSLFKYPSTHTKKQMKTRQEGRPRAWENVPSACQGAIGFWRNCRKKKLFSIMASVLEEIGNFVNRIFNKSGPFPVKKASLMTYSKPVFCLVSLYLSYSIQNFPAENCLHIDDSAICVWLEGDGFLLFDYFGYSNKNGNVMEKEWEGARDGKIAGKCRPVAVCRFRIDSETRMSPFFVWVFCWGSAF